MASQEPSNMASGMMVAGLAGIGVTKLLKTRFAESAAARHSDTLSDRLTKMAPEVAMDYLDYLIIQDFELCPRQPQNHIYHLYLLLFVF